MRSTKHSYHVRFRNANPVSIPGSWCEWIGPVVALGPQAAAIAVVMAEDWTDLPVDLVCEVQDEGLIRDYRMTVSLRSQLLVSLLGRQNEIHVRTALPFLRSDIQPRPLR